MYPDSLRRLIDSLKRLPGVGPKTAERYALHLCHYRPSDAERLLESLANAKASILQCSTCYRVADCDPCTICSDLNRDQSLVLVVAGSPDVEAYERVGDFKGVYHVLCGLINPIDDIGPDKLKVPQLCERSKTEVVKELILGFDPTVEGEVTGVYLSKLLKDVPVKVSRIARGLPMGASVEYADDATLGNALRNRKEMK